MYRGHVGNNNKIHMPTRAYNNNSHNNNSCGNTNMIIIMGNTDINGNSESNYNDSINNNGT